MRVGILGGGQLGCMLASSLHDLGAQVRIFEPEAAAPACSRYREVVVAPWNDDAAVAQFLAGCDVVTYETEHVDASALERLGAPLAPSLHVLRTTQDRALEKQLLARAGLPHVPFAVTHGKSGVRDASEALGFPCIVKTARGGYDGKGQAMLKSAADVEAAQIAEGTPCVVEKALDLELEASCIVARAKGGVEVAFPVVENVHSAHILDLSILPARLPEELARTLRRLAMEAARALDVVGLLTTEFFVTRASGEATSAVRVGDYDVYVNELAPRPHNSGHVTRSACTLSQFDVLARVLLGAPLAPPELASGDSYCMGNLLGDVWLAQGARKTDPTRRTGGDLDLSALSRHPEVVDVVLYGKRDAQPKRKMGHFVTRAPTADLAIAAARAFRSALMR